MNVVIAIASTITVGLVFYGVRMQSLEFRAINEKLESQLEQAEVEEMTNRTLRMISEWDSYRIFVQSTGPQGPQGFQGPQGPQGFQGGAPKKTLTTSTDFSFQHLRFLKRVTYYFNDERYAKKIDFESIAKTLLFEGVDWKLDNIINCPKQDGSEVTDQEIKDILNFLNKFICSGKKN